MRLDEVDDSDTQPKRWLRVRGTPIHQLDDLSKRWNEIAADGGLGPRWTEEMATRK